MRLLTICTLLATSLTATGQSFPAKRGVSVDSSFTKNFSTPYPLILHPATTDTEYTYTDSTGNTVVIQSSLPKGGGYTDSAGKKFAYVIFWTRIINQSTIPVEISLSFPPDSLAIPASPDAFVKVFLPADTMTLGKVTLYNYGLTDLESFLDIGFEKPTSLKRTVKSKEDCLFYVGMLRYQTNGRVRAALVPREQSLFYRVNLLDSLIPCGQIVFKN